MDLKNGFKVAVLSNIFVMTSMHGTHFKKTNVNN